MKKITTLLYSILLFPVISPAQKTITAESVIASINNHEAVNLKDVEVTGDLDFTSLANRELQQQNSSDKVYISTIATSVNFVNCSFTGKVLGYFNPDNVKPFARSHTVYNPNFTAAVSFENCTFQKPVSFKYSIFEEQISFAGSRFKDGAEFKYTKFEKGPTFTGVVFEDEAVFKYVDFPGGFDFSNATFQTTADFKYAKFMNGGSFANAAFKGSADFKYAGFSRSVDMKGAGFSGANDFKYTTLDNEKTSVDELVNKKS